VTLFAGIVSLDPNRAVPPQIGARLRASLSRNRADQTQLQQGDGYAIAFADLGLLEGEGIVVDPSGALSVLAGTPLFESDGEHLSRGDELRKLHETALGGDSTLLRKACGTFCAAFFDPASRRVWLMADSLGLRPLHYAVDDGYLLFSTTLRALEELPLIDRKIDLSGLWQLASLTFTFGGRTPYEAIRMVDAGTIVEAGAGEMRSHVYWRWDEVEQRSVPEGEFRAALFAAFRKSIARRLGNNTSSVAFLSGGLDSRCVVSGLKLSGATVHTLNFSPVGSADLALGRLAADAIGTRHVEISNGPLDYWDRMVSAHATWLQGVAPGERPEYPAQIWTGYGGETVLGPTNVTPEILALLAHGRTDEAITAFMKTESAGLPGRVFPRAVRDAIANAPRAALHEELAWSKCDPGRRLHHLILSHNLRGHLARHHEDIDLRRLEFVFPFLDAALLRVVLSYPLEELMEHRLYHRWLREFPPSTSAVPWQAYPGHEPCPLPMPAGLRAQWSDGWYDKRDRRAELKQLAAAVRQNLADPRFPDALLNRTFVRLALAFVEFGFLQYGYVLKIARTFVRYAGAPAGREAGTDTH